jgi:LacI family transcriptional regulator
VPHPHRVRDIAEQAGLSRATVDRVLHRRPGVRAATVAQVEQAIADLDRQRSQLRLSGRTFVIDLVMQAPQRFSSAVGAALEAELPALRPAVFRSRFHLGEESDPDAVVAILERLGRRGSQGVVLKAPDHPRVAAAVSALVEAGVPVVTFVTDVPLSARLAYVGVDNRAAGATAAYLVTQWCGAVPGGVLVTLSSASFRGEDERELGFRTTLRQLAPQRWVREVAGADGLDAGMLGAVHATLEADPGIDAVYSCGGGNTAIVAAFARLGRRPRVFVAHDLDGDNTRLLRTRQLSAVLHHDLRADMRRACRLVMQAHGALPGSPVSLPSPVQVVTPYNEPSGLTGG